MYNADPTSGRSDNDAIRKKIVKLLVGGNATFVEGSTFKLLTQDTAQLQSLRTAQPHEIDVDPHDVVVDFDYFSAKETNKLTGYDIQVYDNIFLKLYCDPEKFYVREGYDKLYERIYNAWTSKKEYRVVLLGNAGTGKSWFQVYALQQLMSCEKDNRKFDIVIRQVNSRFYVIDLDEAMVYLWKISSDDVEELSFGMTRTLYFFEPGGDGNKSPLEVFLPSLSTLSPCIPRIKEYEKRLCTTLYFWPWSAGELWGMIKDTKLPIDESIFYERYYKFGGILSHVLQEDRKAEENLVEQAESITIDKLTSKALNIDRDTTKDTNVSGFLICYDNRSVEDEDRFATKNLEYTSAYVVEKVKIKLRTHPMKDSMQTVLNRLSGSVIDVSGKNLERSAAELISLGGKFKWAAKEIGTDQPVWTDFKTTKREIIRQFGLSDRFDQDDKIIVPENMTFPVVDFVFTCPNAMQPVVAFQCTWCTSHKTPLRALCTLRRTHMKIPDNRRLNIYIVAPKNEDVYASRKKMDLLVGKLDRDVKLDATTTLQPTELQSIWDNTNFFVIRPKSCWEEQITKYLSQ